MANKGQQKMPEPCRACSNQFGIHVEGEIWRCGACDGIQGTCYLGDSYKYVLPYFRDGEIPVEEQRYFDFTTLGSAGVDRRHGWYDPASKRIVQVG